jgi:hypothetical protein
MDETETLRLPWGIIKDKENTECPVVGLQIKFSNHPSLV